jgi:hypothetical protein
MRSFTLNAYDALTEGNLVSTTLFGIDLGRDSFQFQHGSIDQSPQNHQELSP